MPSHRWSPVGTQRHAAPSPSGPQLCPQGVGSHPAAMPFGAPVGAFGTPATSKGNSTFSRALRQGNADSSWNTIPTERCGPLIASPSIRTFPS